MKQRIRVVGIAHRDGGVLLMKKNQKRLDMTDVVWELPTGKILFGEQPEEAISRIFYDYLSINVRSVKIRDAVTFLSLGGASQLNNLYIVYDVEIEDKKIYSKDIYSAYKIIKEKDDLNSHGIRLDEASATILNLSESGHAEQKHDYRESINGATVYVDGCSRGNPGPSAIGYYIVDMYGKVIESGGEFIGFATSRMAEYCAMREGCRKATLLGLRNVRFVSDSLMMVNQLNGIYTVKNRDLVDIYKDVKSMTDGFDACAFVHVKREQNKIADRIANEALDRHFDENVVE